VPSAVVVAVVLRSCEWRLDIVLSFAANFPVRAAFVYVSVVRRSLSAIAAMAGLANASSFSV
jgi:hypothetical protein